MGMFDRFRRRNTATDHDTVSDPTLKATDDPAVRVADLRAHSTVLDSVRGIAIWAVVMHHALSLFGGLFGAVYISGTNWDVTELLHFIPAVPLFFLLSGYLLIWTEDRRVRSGTYNLRSYAFRRILRLVPAYYVAIVVVLIFFPGTVNLLDLGSHLLFLHGFTLEYGRSMASAFWSLTPEVTFYLILPIFVLYLKELWMRLAAFFILLLVSFPFRLWALDARVAQDDPIPYGEPDIFQFYASFPLTYLYLFIAGMLLRMLVEYLGSKSKLRYQDALTFCLFAVSSSYLFFKPGLGPFRLSLFGVTGVRIEQWIVSDLMLIGFFASAVLGAPVFKHLLEWKWLGRLGLISYSMFVFYQEKYRLMKNYYMKNPSIRTWIEGSNVGLGFAVYLLLTWTLVIIVSYIGYKFIEKPFLRIKPK